ncbi:prepilin peptidase [Corynebacterium mayonis]|uniref:prepilin peptidase n=1 Tax=Corynebacterium mayonis TaxID=3062461 RepID=UPI0031409C77
MGGGGLFVLVVCAAVWSVALAYWDLRWGRLPDFLTLPAGALALGSIWLWPAAVWALVWPAFYLLGGRGIGGGDIKLALPLGAAVAVSANHFALVWVLGAIGISGLFTLLIACGAGRREVAHGPSMLLAAWLTTTGAHLWLS